MAVQQKSSPKEYTFTAEETRMLTEVQEQITALQHQQEGALKLIIRQNKLEGEWKFANGKLVQSQMQPLQIVEAAK